MDDSSKVCPSTVEYFELEEAENSFEELFNLRKSSNNRPLKERKFPKSFFFPDISKTDKNNPTISHSKTNSSPATFSQELLKLSTNTSHQYQKSLPNSSIEEYIPPLPDFRNPQIHKFYVPNLKNAKQQIPDGYEMAINADNKVYFLNHKTKQTSWFDPRIPQSYQKWGMNLHELDNAHKAYNDELVHYSHPTNSENPLIIRHQRMNAIAMNYNPIVMGDQNYPDPYFGFSDSVILAEQPLEQNMEELQLTKMKTIKDSNCLMENLSVNNNNESDYRAHHHNFQIYGSTLSNEKNSSENKDSHNDTAAAILTNDALSTFIDDSLGLSREAEGLSDVIGLKDSTHHQHSYQNSIDSGVQCHTNIPLSDEELFYGGNVNQNATKNSFLPYGRFDRNFDTTQNNLMNFGR